MAKREYIERVRSRAFVFSTLLLVGLAVVVALIPLGVRLLDRVSVTRIGIVSPDPALALQAVNVMDQILNARPESSGSTERTFEFEARTNVDATTEDVRDGVLAGAVVLQRKPDGGLDFQVVTAGALSPDRAQLLQIGAFGVGILDWTAKQPPNTGTAFSVPTFSVVDAAATTAGGAALSVDTAEYASRRIVGIVFVVLSFLTLVFYGLWVASGVVAEKASRVMELLISAATAPQLVVGKIGGIGLAGLTQVSLVLLPAILALMLSGRLGRRDVRRGRARDAVARRAVAGAAGGVPRVLRARLRALCRAVRGSWVAAQPRPRTSRSWPCRCRSPRSWATSRPCSRCRAARDR